MWDERYGAEAFAYGTEPNDFLVSVVEQLPPTGRVLCLAEGEGRNAVYLAGLGYEVHAVDASAVGLEKAQRLAQSRNVQIETRVADLADYVIEPGSWDAIVSIWCHVPPPVRERLHRQVEAGLRPGGVLVLEAYTPRQLEFGTGGPPVAEMMMTLESLRAELPGLDFRQAVETERDVVEGLYHTGRGAVVQLLALRPAVTSD